MGPSRGIASCARRSPDKPAKDPGSIPGTSTTSKRCAPAHRPGRIVVSGQVAAAWIGLFGQNPRKGVTHTREDVAAELADVVFTALLAIESLGPVPRAVVRRRAMS